jgi:hypothetical protein
MHHLAISSCPQALSSASPVAHMLLYDGRISPPWREYSTFSITHALFGHPRLRDYPMGQMPIG